jgi:hypothetical protein
MPILVKQKRALSRRNMVVSTHALPAEMHRRLRRAASAANVAVAEAVREAVALWLARHARRRRGRGSR